MVRSEAVRSGIFEIDESFRHKVLSNLPSGVLLLWRDPRSGKNQS
jgi:hypothetical protein